MTLLAPLWLGVGIAAALGVLALHYIARRRPPPMMYPTARFVPDLPARAASRAPRPTDPLLLALRALAALLLGLAFAGPVLTPARAPRVRVVMVDRSIAVANPDSAARIAVSLLRPGDLVIPFDTVPAPRTWEDGAELPPLRQAPADLTAALLAGVRAAHAASRRADSVELILVSPLDRGAWNAALLPVRRDWPGAVRIERVAAVRPDSTPPAVAVRGAPDDAVRATVALLGRLAAASPTVRIVRTAATSADSAWARDSAGVLVVWPDAASVGTPGEPAGGVAAGDAVAVGPWLRHPVPDGRVVARWADGGAAATETVLGRGCVRHVGVGIPDAGDAALSPGAQRLAAELTRPCGPQTVLGPPADSLVRRLAGSGGAVPGSRIAQAGVATAPATPWLLAAGVILLLAEWLLRGRGRRA